MNSIAFPDCLTAAMVKSFRQLPRGSTHPHDGWINNRHYVLKCGSYSTTSSDAHVHNEFVADEFLRTAGCNVPLSREYRADIGNGLETVRLAQFVEGAKELLIGWNEVDADGKKKIRRQVIESYPLQAFIFGTDTYQHSGIIDNTLVDNENNIWFIDNGASFHFRARGGDRSEFWSRDPKKVGEWFFELKNHRSQGDLRRLLGMTTDEELRQAAAKYDFVSLVKTLPADYQRKELVECAAALNEWSGYNKNSKLARNKI